MVVEARPMASTPLVNSHRPPRSVSKRRACLWSGPASLTSTKESARGLVTEAVEMQWDQIDWSKNELHVCRLKGGKDSRHPLQGDETRALRKLRQEQNPASRFMFTSERGGPFSRFAVNKMIEKAGEQAGIRNCHPHMLRHACGHLLADAGHD